MRVLRIDESSPHTQLIGVGGIGTGIFFDLASDDSLGRNESRAGRLLDVRDYCKLHIVIHYVATLLGARISGSPFHVVPVGRVGNDAAGCQLIKEMAEGGIDTTAVAIQKAELCTILARHFLSLGKSPRVPKFYVDYANPENVPQHEALLRTVLLIEGNELSTVIC